MMCFFALWWCWGALTGLMDEEVLRCPPAVTCVLSINSALEILITPLRSYLYLSGFLFHGLIQVLVKRQ